MMDSVIMMKHHAQMCLMEEFILVYSFTGRIHKDEGDAWEQVGGA